MRRSWQVLALSAILVGLACRATEATRAGAYGVERRAVLQFDDDMDEVADEGAMFADEGEAFEESAAFEEDSFDRSSVLELKQEALKEDLSEELKVIGEQEQKTKEASRTAKKVAKNAGRIAEKWRDIQVALLDLYNVSPQASAGEDVFYQEKVDEIKKHLKTIVHEAAGAATQMEEVSDEAEQAAEAFADSDLATEEGDLGAEAEAEDVEQEIADISSTASSEGEDVVEEAKQVEEAAQDALEKVDGISDMIEDGVDTETVNDAVEELQESVEEATEMTEQLEDDAELVATETDEASKYAKLERETIEMEAENLGVQLDTK